MQVDADSVTMAYPEITLVGASANRVLGNWLLKGEYAHSDGDLHLREHGGAMKTPDSDGVSEEGRSHQLMLGGRYSGVRNLMLDLELLSSRIGSIDGASGEERTQVKGVASIEYEMLNDDLVVNLTYMGWANEPASMLRFRLDYAFRDEIILFVGAINFSASTEKAMLAPYQNNDRVFSGFTLSF